MLALAVALAACDVEEPAVPLIGDPVLDSRPADVLSDVSPGDVVLMRAEIFTLGGFTTGPPRGSRQMPERVSVETWMLVGEDGLVSDWFTVERDETGRFLSRMWTDDGVLYERYRQEAPQVRRPLDGSAGASPTDIIAANQRAAEAFEPPSGAERGRSAIDGARVFIWSAGGCSRSQSPARGERLRAIFVREDGSPFGESCVDRAADGSMTLLDSDRWWIETRRMDQWMASREEVVGAAD